MVVGADRRAHRPHREPGRHRHPPLPPGRRHRLRLDRLGGRGGGERRLPQRGAAGGGARPRSSPRGTRDRAATSSPRRRPRSSTAAGTGCRTRTRTSRWSRLRWGPTPTRAAWSTPPSPPSTPGPTRRRPRDAAALGGHGPRGGAQLVAGDGGLQRVRGGVARRGRRHLGHGRGHGAAGRALGPRAVRSPGTRWLARAVPRAPPSRTWRSVPSRPVPRFASSIVRPGWRFKGGRRGRAEHLRPRSARRWRMLEREVGRRPSPASMRTYAERWAFRHPAHR